MLSSILSLIYSFLMVMSGQSVGLDNVSADSDASFSSVRATLKRLDTDTVTTCTIKELSGAWITIEPEVQLPQGALVQIQFNGYIGLGEVIQITQQRWRIQLEHIFKPEDAGRFMVMADHDHERRVLLDFVR